MLDMLSAVASLTCALPVSLPLTVNIDRVLGLLSLHSHYLYTMYVCDSGK